MIFSTWLRRRRFLKSLKMGTVEQVGLLAEATTNIVNDKYISREHHYARVDELLKANTELVAQRRALQGQLEVADEIINKSDHIFTSVEGFIYSFTAAKRFFGDVPATIGDINVWMLAFADGFHGRELPVGEHDFLFEAYTEGAKCALATFTEISSTVVS